MDKPKIDRVFTEKELYLSEIFDNLWEAGYRISKPGDVTISERKHHGGFEQFPIDYFLDNEILTFNGETISHELFYKCFDKALFITNFYHADDTQPNNRPLKRQVKPK